MRYRRVRAKGGCYFFTVVTFNREKILTRDDNVDLLRRSLRRVMGSRQRKKEQAVWQWRFWEHRIRDERDFIKHVEYIHYNPVRHHYAAALEDWPFSSFHKFVRQGKYALSWSMDVESDSKHMANSVGWVE